MDGFEAHCYFELVGARFFRESGPSKNRRSFDYAPRDKTASGSAQDDNSHNG